MAPKEHRVDQVQRRVNDKFQNCSYPGCLRKARTKGARFCNTRGHSAGTHATTTRPLPPSGVLVTTPPHTQYHQRVLDFLATTSRLNITLPIGPSDPERLPSRAEILASEQETARLAGREWTTAGSKSPPPPTKGARTSRYSQSTTDR